MICTKSNVAEFGRVKKPETSLFSRLMAFWSCTDRVAVGISNIQGNLSSVVSCLLTSLHACWTPHPIFPFLMNSMLESSGQKEATVVELNVQTQKVNTETWGRDATKRDVPEGIHWFSGDG